MNTSGEAAETVVRMALEGTEVLLKLSGKGAYEAAKRIHSALKGQKRTKGAMRLSSMLRSGKALKVFTFGEKDLRKFKDVAKQYGILYTILKEKDHTGGVFDVLVRAEDESKIARIIERFEFANVSGATIKSEIIKEQSEKEQKADGEKDVPEKEHPEKSREQKILDDLFSKPIQKEEQATENPTTARAEEKDNRYEERSQSEPLSKQEKDLRENYGGKKPSVRKEMERLKKQRAEKVKNVQKMNELGENKSIKKEDKTK